MKKIITILLALYSIALTAQIPQGISYQGIAFTSGGAPVVSGNIAIRISILDNSTSGTVVYKETHAKTTNAKGLFNLNIGQGTPVTGTFSGINWAVNSKFLKVEIDPAGGTNYTSVGTNQLMTVPFAFLAAGISTSSGNSLNDEISDNKYSNLAFKDGPNHKVYAFSAKTNAWYSITLGDYTNPVIMPSNGNFGFDDGILNKVNVFNGKTGVWSSQAYDVNNIYSIGLTASNGNYAFVDRGALKVFVYNSKSNTWSSQAYGPTSSSGITLVESNGNFAFEDHTGNKIVAWSSTTATWASVNVDPYSNDSISAGNGNFFYNDSAGDKMDFYNAKTGTWSSQTYDPYANPVIIVSESN